MLNSKTICSKKIFSISIIFISAFLTILSHPTVIEGFEFPSFGFLAWITYIPLLSFLENKSSKQQFKLSFLFGFIFYSGSMYWLYTALNSFGNLSPLISVMVLFLLILILSTYFGIIFFLSASLEKYFKVSRFWILPLIWILVEWCRNHWPVGGFPWGQAGYSQARYPLLIQIADLTGVYGVTAFLVWVNLAGVEIFKKIFYRPLFPSSPDYRKRGFYLQTDKKKLFFITLLIFTVFIYGYYSKKKLSEKILHLPKIRIALLQGNIPQNEKWLREQANKIFRIYLEMTQKALLQEVDFLIWPESAYPYEISLDEATVPKQLSSLFADFSNSIRFPKLLFGAVTFEGRLPPDALYVPPEFPIHNSALLFDPRTNEIQFYHKQHLVPYGEYIPLKEVFPFIKKLTAQMGEFQPGKTFNPLISGDVRIGSLICYEDVFPEIARKQVNAGANLLVNLSNDAWYGNSSALPQHLNFSIFRSIENRRSLVRATNTGKTAFIDPIGNIRITLPSFKQDLLIEEASILSSTNTFYSRFGDVFVLGSATILFLIFISRWLYEHK